METIEKQCFINESQISFNLRNSKSTKPTQVYMIVRLDGKQHKISTGVKVYAEHWNKKKQQAYISCRISELDNYNNEIVNKTIKDMKERYVTFKRYICDNTDDINNKLTVLYSIMSKKKKTETKVNNTNIIYQKIEKFAYDRKGATQKTYITNLAIFKEYIEEKKLSLTWDMFNYSFLKEFERYIITKHYSVNTISNYVTTLRTLLNDCYRELEEAKCIDVAGLDMYQKLKDRAKNMNDNEAKYLTTEEIEAIRKLPLQGRLDEVRDLFIVQCCVGRRISEIMDIAKNAEYYRKDIEITKGVIHKDKLFVKYNERKNNKLQYSYLNDIAEEIVLKYDYKLPVMSYTTIIHNLKEVFKLAKINAEYSVYVDYGGETVEKQTKQKWELIGTHTARKSFITNNTLDNLNKDVIKGASGHTTDYAYSLYNMSGGEQSAFAYAKAVLNNDSSNNSINDNVTDNVIKQNKQEIDKDTLEEAKRVLTFLGADAVTVMDVTNIDDANRLIYTQYERELTGVGIDYHIIKDLYNDNSKATLRDKRAALMQIVDAIKSNETKKKKRKNKKDNS